MELNVDFTNLKTAVLKMSGYRVDKIKNKFIAFAPQSEMPENHFRTEDEAWKHLIAIWEQQQV